MGLITIPNVFTPNTTIKSAEVNANFNTLANLVNGALDTNNLAAAAGIVAGQLANPLTFADGQLRQTAENGQVYAFHIDANGDPYWVRIS